MLAANGDGLATCALRVATLQPVFLVETGQLTNPRYIINFPTKRHWRGRPPERVLWMAPGDIDGDGRADYPSTMQFGPWRRLVADEFPSAPGVLQLRREHGLVVYPRGRSAMIRYLVAADLRAEVTRLAAAHPGRPWLVRCNRAPLRDPAGELARLLADFHDRFGAAPHDDDDS